MQVIQLFALACENPADSGRPISHWTTGELAMEMVTWRIVQSISPRHAIPNPVRKPLYSLTGRGAEDLSEQGRKIPDLKGGYQCRFGIRRLLEKAHLKPHQIRYWIIMIERAASSRFILNKPVNKLSSFGNWV